MTIHGTWKLAVALVVKMVCALLPYPFHTKITPFLFMVLKILSLDELDFESSLEL